VPSVGFVIGNGLSRENFNLDYLVGCGVTAGCNRLHEDFDPNYLMAIDTHMVKTLREVDCDHKWKLVTRDVVDNEFWITCDNKPVVPVKNINNGFINNAGLLATAFMSEVLRMDEVYMIGIDFFLRTPDRNNNVYGKNCKQSVGIHNVWNTLPERNPKTTFYRVGAISMDDLWFYNHKLKGFEFINFEDMPI